MDTTADARDFELLKQDKYTFSVLSNVLESKCRLVFTDHRSFIICHSEDPYPVWIWTEDNVSDDTKETVWNLVSEHCPANKGYKFNLKYELADYFLMRGKETGADMHITTQLLAYDCPSPVVPGNITNGALHCCDHNDIEEAAILHHTFFAEAGTTQTTPEQSRQKVTDHIDKGEFFFWKDDQGMTVACCDYHISGDLAYIGCVYTVPAQRRKHYAQHLVYRVTKLVSDKGYMPMLYTDALYPASNECYRKIGYILRGEICMISA